MAASINDLFAKASSGDIPVATTLASQKASGAVSMSLSAATHWPTDTAVHVLLYQVDAAGKVVSGSVTVWKGVVSGTTLGSIVLRGGTDATYPSNSQVVIAPTDSWADDLITGILVAHNQDGTLKSGLTITTPTLVSPALQGTVDGWVNVTDAWTYASATTITVPTDATTRYDGGDLLKLTQGGVTSNYVIVAVAATLLTVMGIGGATIANSAISAQAYSKGRNPHGMQLFGQYPYAPVHFSMYRSAALTPTSGGVLTCDTKEWDTGSNADVVTNKGRFTAPAAGFYWFVAETRYAGTAINQNFGITLNKNGVVAKEGSAFVQMFNGATSTVRCHVSAMLKLAATDYVEAAVITDGTEALSVALGAADNYFQGYLYSLL